MVHMEDSVKDRRHPVFSDLFVNFCRLCVYASGSL